MMYSVCPSNPHLVGKNSKHGLLGSFTNLNSIQLELVHHTEIIFKAYDNLYKGVLQSRPETPGKSAFIFCRKLPPNTM